MIDMLLQKTKVQDTPAKGFKPQVLVDLCVTIVNTKHLLTPKAQAVLDLLAKYETEVLPHVPSVALDTTAVANLVSQLANLDKFGGCFYASNPGLWSESDREVRHQANKAVYVYAAINDASAVSLLMTSIAGHYRSAHDLANCQYGPTLHYVNEPLSQALYVAATYGYIQVWDAIVTNCPGGVVMH